MSAARRSVACLAVAACAVSSCGAKQDHLAASLPGKRLIAITTFRFGAGSWDFRAYLDRGRPCMAYEGPSRSGSHCLAEVGTGRRTQALTVADQGSDAFVGFTTPDVAAVRYVTRYGPSVAVTQPVPGLLVGDVAVRYFLAMHASGLVRPATHPIAVDARGDRLPVRITTP